MTVTEIDSKIKTIKLDIFTKKSFLGKTQFVFSFKIQIDDSLKNANKSDIIDGLVVEFADFLIGGRFLSVDEKILIPIDDISYIDYSKVYDQIMNGNLGVTNNGNQSDSKKR